MLVLHSSVVVAQAEKKTQFEVRRGNSYAHLLTNWHTISLNCRFKGKVISDVY
jgi:hypothetical protein